MRIENNPYVKMGIDFVNQCASGLDKITKSPSATQQLALKTAAVALGTGVLGLALGFSLPGSLALTLSGGACAFLHTCYSYNFGNEFSDNLKDGASELANFADELVNKFK